MTEREVLSEVRAFLAEPSGWCQGAAARNVQGVHVSPRSAQAVAWCLVGAVERVEMLSGAFQPAVWQRLNRLLGRRLVRGLAYWNDTWGRTHAEVLALLDCALAEIDAETVG